MKSSSGTICMILLFALVLASASASQSYLQNGGTVKCTAQYTHAVMATGGGTMRVNNINMNTAGGNSGAIATDRSSGAITVTGGVVKTASNDSPSVNSTGIITVTGATITATASEAVVIEGLHSTTLNNCTLQGSANQYGGVLVVHSMSGDAAQGTAKFIMTGGSLTSLFGPLFFVTNTDAVIRLQGASLVAASGVIINAAATTRWGKTGKNGGIVVCVADAQLKFQKEIIRYNVWQDLSKSTASRLRNLFKLYLSSIILPSIL